MDAIFFSAPDISLSAYEVKDINFEIGSKTHFQLYFLQEINFSVSDKNNKASLVAQW